MAELDETTEEEISSADEHLLAATDLLTRAALLRTVPEGRTSANTKALEVLSRHRARNHLKECLKILTEADGNDSEVYLF